MPRKTMPAGPGRPKGCKNKITRDVRRAILDAWAKLEKQNKSLAAVAKDDPKWFYEHFVKGMIPKDIKLDGDIGLVINIVRYGDDKPTK